MAVSCALLERQSEPEQPVLWTGLRTQEKENKRWRRQINRDRNCRPIAEFNIVRILVQDAWFTYLRFTGWLRGNPVQPYIHPLSNPDGQETLEGKTNPGYSLFRAKQLPRLPLLHTTVNTVIRSVKYDYLF